MKAAVLALGVCMALGAMVPDVEAHNRRGVSGTRSHSGAHRHNHFRGGAFYSSAWVGVPLYYGPYGYYVPYPYYYAPTPALAGPPAYYCPATRAYYPQVADCPGGWEPVIPPAMTP